jgi:putative hydrolase of the HAD superfamily
MNRLNNIKGIIFDYGGTLDTPSIHWSEVLWSGYQSVGVPVEKEPFRDAYVHGERALARNPIVQPDFTFFRLLEAKVEIELRYLVDNGFLAVDYPVESVGHEIVCYCHEFVRQTVKNNLPVLEALSAKYPLVLVSNFYGNIHTVLEEFGLSHFFKEVVESAVVGVRKPDPAIFKLGVEALQLIADEVVVVADSFSKDIQPARAAGCHAIWFKGVGWGNEVTDESVPDAVITSFAELQDVLL